MKSFKKEANKANASRRSTSRSATRSRSKSRARSMSKNRSQSKNHNRRGMNPLHVDSRGANYVNQNRHLEPDYMMPIDAIHYKPDKEPDFWRPFFKPKEMFELREKIQKMIQDDINPSGGYKKEWSICNLAKSFLRTYDVPSEMVVDRQPNGSERLPHEPYFVIYNVLLCASFIVTGIVAHKMRGQDYEIALKGGKAVQILLDNTPDAPIYPSEDIDVIILPMKKEYNLVEIKNVAGNFAHLLHWFLDMPESAVNVSIQPPDKPRANPHLYKMSFGALYPALYENGVKLVMKYKAIMDIDFKEMTADMRSGYDNPYVKTVDIRPLNEEARFFCPNIDAVLDEKLIHYVKYFNYLKRITQKERVVEERDGIEYSLIEPECKRMMKKFGKAIYFLTEGIVKTEEDHTLKAKRRSIIKRFIKLGGLGIPPQDRIQVSQLIFP